MFSYRFLSFKIKLFLIQKKIFAINVFFVANRISKWIGYWSRADIFYWNLWKSICESERIIKNSLILFVRDMLYARTKIQFFAPNVSKIFFCLRIDVWCEIVWDKIYLISNQVINFIFVRSVHTKYFYYFYLLLSYNCAMTTFHKTLNREKTYPDIPDRRT